MFKHSKKSIAVLLSCVALYGCGKKEETVVTNELRPTDVRTLEVMNNDYQDTYVLSGVAEAWDIVDIPSETMGPVTWVGVEEGDYVKKGQQILRVNSDTVEANLASTKVQLDARKTDLARTENLFKEKAVSQKSFDDAQDAFRLATLSYNIAQDEFEKSTIESPADGVVDSIIPDFGEYIQPGMTVATVIENAKLKIYLDVPEKDVPYLEIGQPVEVYVADVTTNEPTMVKGVVNYVSISSDPKSLTYRARVDIDGNKGIMAGQIVRAKIVRQQFENAIAVELYNVIDKDGGKVVYIVNNNKAVEVPVELGDMFDEMVLIKNGLNAGDMLVVSGQQFLRNDAPVRLAE